MNTPTLDTFGLVDFATLVTEADRPTDWLVEDLMPSGEVWLIHGASHSGKTYALLDLGLAVAYGTPWLGRFPVPTAQPVIYAPSEGRRGIAKRVIASVEYHHAYDAPPPFNLWDENLDLTEEKSPSLLRLAKATEASGARLVIVDVLRDATPGIEENTAKMGDAFGRLRDLAHHTGATVLVAHHAGKDTTKGARGHSSLKDKADQEVSVRVSEASTSIDEKPLSTVVVVENTKNRNEDRWGAISLDLRKTRDDALAPIIVGEYLVSGRPQGAIIDKPAHLSMLRALRASTTIDNLSTSGGTTTTRELVEETGKSKQAIVEAAKALVSGGFVELDKTGKAHRYTLTEAGRHAIDKYDNPSTSTDKARNLSTSNPQHPIGAGGVVDGDPDRVTTLEQLREVEAQEAPDEVVEEGGEAVLSIPDILAARGQR